MALAVFVSLFSLLLRLDVKGKHSETTGTFFDTAATQQEVKVGWGRFGYIFRNKKPKLCCFEYFFYSRHGTSSVGECIGASRRRAAEQLVVALAEKNIHG